MNIPRDLGLARFAPAGDEASRQVWGAAEACLRPYVKLLDHPNPELLVALSLHHTVERVREDPALDPATTALGELHRLLAEGDGSEPESTPESSVAWRLQRWTGGEAALRSAPPIRLRHMVPEGFSLGRAKPQEGLVEGLPCASLGLEAPGEL